MTDTATQAHSRTLADRQNATEKAIIVDPVNSAHLRLNRCQCGDFLRLHRLHVQTGPGPQLRQSTSLSIYNITTLLHTSLLKFIHVMIREWTLGMQIQEYYFALYGPLTALIMYETFPLSNVLFDQFPVSSYCKHWLTFTNNHPYVCK